MTGEAEVLDVLIVGAGISGLLAARHLREHGIRVLLLDKGRHVGGRMATRHEGQAVFDHGAQFFTVRDETLFRPIVQSLLDAGIAREWATGFALQGGGFQETDEMRYCGVKGIRTIPEFLAQGLDTRHSTKVVSIAQDHGSWSVACENGITFTSKAVLLTCPVPESLALIKGSGAALGPTELEQLTSIEYLRCIAMMAVLEKPSKIPAPGGLWLASEPVSWLGDNRQKGLTEANAVTVHAGPQFSLDHWDERPEVVARRLITAASRWLGSAPVRWEVHRWRYSQPVTPYPAPCFLANAIPPLLLSGDAFGGPRVEGAALSGLAAADRLLELLQ